MQELCRLIFDLTPFCLVAVLTIDDALLMHTQIVTYRFQQQRFLEYRVSPIWLLKLAEEASYKPNITIKK